MRSALQQLLALLLLLLLLGPLSCGGANTTTPASSTVSSPSTLKPASSTPLTSGSPAPSIQTTQPSTAPSPGSTGGVPPTKSTLSSSTTVAVTTSPGVTPTTSKGAPSATDNTTTTTPSVGSTASRQTSANIVLKTTAGGAGSTGSALPTHSGASDSPGKVIPTSSPTEKPKETSAVPTAVKNSIAPTTRGGTATTLGSSSVAKVPGTTVPVHVQTTGKSTVPPGPTTSKPGPVKPPDGITPRAPDGTPKGTKGGALTATPTPSAVSHPAKPRPGTSVTTEVTSVTTKMTTPKHSDLSPDGGSRPTSGPAESKIDCESKTTPKDGAIILTLNTSSSCDSLEKGPLKEKLLSLLCGAVNPNFNKSRDDCTVRVASVPDDPKKLAIIGASVTTHAVNDVLSEVLAMKRGELEKLGVSNMTQSGRPLDIDAEDRFGMPLIITIVCLAASLLLVAAIYGCCHQRISHRKDQQRLTEELQTMENGYHDNPTLEVMETSSEMQEKKVNLNGELADSWIVPMDSLMKEELEDEEDTHL